MKVSFELSPRDLRYFRERLKSARAGAGAQDEPSVIKQATQLVEDAIKVDPPEFVRVRLLRLEQLVEMLRDEEWRLEGRDRARILDALVYFVDPDDLIPDRLPGIGYLDDAIMIELVVEELKHDIKAYEDFCAFRKTRSKREPRDQLESRRETLQGRMRRRRRRERDVARERPRAARSPLRLW